MTWLKDPPGVWVEGVYPPEWLFTFVTDDGELYRVGIPERVLTSDAAVVAEAIRNEADLAASAFGLEGGSLTVGLASVVLARRALLRSRAR